MVVSPLVSLPLLVLILPNYPFSCNPPKVLFPFPIFRNLIKSFSRATTSTANLGQLFAGRWGLARFHGLAGQCLVAIVESLFTHVRLTFLIVLAQ